VSLFAAGAQALPELKLRIEITFPWGAGQETGERTIKGDRLLPEASRRIPERRIGGADGSRTHDLLNATQNQLMTRS
jgi:hypothetical protein